MNAATEPLPVQLPDEALLPRIRAGEHALFEILMRRHNQKLYRAIRAVVRDEAEIEDVMQQTYLAAFSHLAQFTGQARFATWLLRIGINEALARVRRARRLVALDDGQEATREGAHEAARAEEPGMDYGNSPEQRAARRELGTLLERCIDLLPDTYREVLMLRLVEGLDTAETAQILDLTEETTKQRLHRARSMIQRAIDQEIGASAREVFAFHADRCDRVVAAVMRQL